MRDTADEEIDAEVATQIGEGYAEANQLSYGDLNREDFDALDRPVAPEVAQAWVQHARDEINPVFEKSLIDDIRDWYATEVRQLNHMHGESGGEDMPVPVTARVVMWVIRFSMAFARCHLRERVVESDVARATTLAKRLVAQNWDGEQFTPEAAKPKTQKERKERIRDAVPSDDAVTVAEVAERANVTENVARNELDNLAQAGELARPSTGVYRRV
jgi:DNA replicative helicase MCM subunit Mcm2 (Cdc46/Mcm family)